MFVLEAKIVQLINVTVVDANIVAIKNVLPLEW
jgi:hypothetical protein